MNGGGGGGDRKEGKYNIANWKNQRIISKKEKKKFWFTHLANSDSTNKVNKQSQRKTQSSNDKKKTKDFFSFENETHNIFKKKKDKQSFESRRAKEEIISGWLFSIKKNEIKKKQKNKCLMKFKTKEGKQKTKKRRRSVTETNVK